jgi:hypothetical protein
MLADLGALGIRAFVSLYSRSVDGSQSVGLFLAIQ